MTNGNPTSWRDVYDLVNDTKKDIQEDIARLSTQIGDHATRIEVLETERDARTSVRLAIRGTVNNGRTLVMTVIAVAAFVVALLK